jgi:leader peptidase (prepilin peptidase)/N-methyltransferase
MDFLSYLYIFILGACIGSFINVLALRYNTGMSAVSGSSQCFHCGTPLRWYELIPLVSFIIQLGKCRTCGVWLPWRYFVVEVVMGILFVGIAMRQYYYWPLYSGFQHGLLYSVLFFVFYAFVFSLLVAIMLYDIRHMIIPDPWVYLFIALSLYKLLVFICYRSFIFARSDMLDILAWVILFLPFALLWAFSSGRWIGFGDAKLALGIGALLGFTSGLSAVILAFWIGAVWSVGMILWRRFKGHGDSITFSSEVPFAPFLIIATAIVFFTRIDVLNIGAMIELL